MNALKLVAVVIGVGFTAGKIGGMVGRYQAKKEIAAVEAKNKSVGEK